MSAISWPDSTLPEIFRRRRFGAAPTGHWDVLADVVECERHLACLGDAASIVQACFQ